MIKEFFQIIRDPSTLLISVVLPLFLLFVYGFGVSLDMDNIRIGLVMEDQTEGAQGFAQSLTDSRFLKTEVGLTRAPFYEAITRGTIRGIVVVPSYFSQFRERTDTIAPIQVIADGSEPNTASFVQNYVRGAWENWITQEGISNGERQSAPLVQADPRIWFNESLESRDFLIPGSLALIMTLIGTLLTSLVVAREWERGTMEALMATPVKTWELIVGKLVPYFLLGLGSMLIGTAVGVLLYQIPFRGSLIALTATSALFLLVALGIGLLISTLSRNQFVAAQASIVSSFLPALVLSGFIFEISSMPTPIRLLSLLIPARYFVRSLQTLFLAGNIWRLLAIDALILLLMALVIFTITAHRTVKRLD
ncbi:MAG: ABC transporter permease [Parachlamydiales bacterium]